MKTRIINIVLSVLLVLAIVIPGLSCSEGDPWTDTWYQKGDLYIWYGEEWVQITGEGGGGGEGLWEVDGSETQLIDADEVDMQTYKIINVVDPTSNQDAATKKYVDDNAGGAPGGNTCEIVGRERLFYGQKYGCFYQPLNNISETRENN